MARANNGGWDFVKVGQVYQYKEDWFIATVRILEDNSTAEEYVFKLQVENSNIEPLAKDGVFDVLYNKNIDGFFNGMSQFFKEPVYDFEPTWEKKKD